MLLHVTPGRWLRGKYFRGRKFVLVGLPVKIGEFVSQFHVTKMLLHVTLGRWCRVIYPVGFSGEGLFIRYFGV